MVIRWQTAGAACLGAHSYWHAGHCVPDSAGCEGGSSSECACVRAFRRGREAWGRARGGGREEKRREAERVCLWELVRAEGVSLEARFPRVPRAPCYAYGLPARAGQLWSVVARDGLDEAGDLAIGCVLLESSEPRKDNSMQC